jgi:hypothetical protein
MKLREEVKEGVFLWVVLDLEEGKLAREVVALHARDLVCG